MPRWRPKNPESAYYKMLIAREKEIIEWALGHPNVDGNIVAAARLLGVSRPLLYKRMHIVGLSERIQDKRDWRKTQKIRDWYTGEAEAHAALRPPTEDEE